jgi:hypothetical protein
MRTHLSKKIIFFMFFIFSFLPLVSFAQNVTTSAKSGGGGGAEYTPIAKNFFTEGISFEKMLERIFQVSIILTIVLVVIMIIVGGVEYMGSESVFKKGEGKERIFAAISGLLIALVSILLISTILPGGTGSAFKINIFETSSSQ